MPLAQPEMGGKVASLRFARISSKDVQGRSNCSMFFQRVFQTSDKGPFQNAEALGWIRSRAELFAQNPRRSFPRALPNPREYPRVHLQERPKSETRHQA